MQNETLNKQASSPFEQQSSKNQNNAFKEEEQEKVSTIIQKQRSQKFGEGTKKSAQIQQKKKRDQFIKEFLLKKERQKELLRKENQEFFRKKAERNRLKALTKKKTPQEELQQKLQQQKKQRQEKQQKQMAPYLQKYKKMQSIDLTGSEMNYFFEQQKGKLFKMLIIGYLELKQFNNQKLNEDQAKVLGLKNFQLFNLALNLSEAVDKSMKNTFYTTSARRNVDRFKNTYRQFIINVSDQDNFELRKKLLTKKIDPASIPKTPEAQFHSQQKAKRIREQTELMIRQSEASPKKTYLEEQQFPIQQFQIPKPITPQEQPEKKQLPIELYYDMNTLKDLKKFISEQRPEIVEKMINWLFEEEQYAQKRQFFLRNIQKVFKIEQSSKMEEQF